MRSSATSTPLPHIDITNPSALISIVDIHSRHPKRSNTANMPGPIDPLPATEPDRPQTQGEEEAEAVAQSIADKARIIAERNKWFDDNEKLRRRAAQGVKHSTVKKESREEIFEDLKAFSAQHNFQPPIVDRTHRYVIHIPRLPPGSKWKPRTNDCKPRTVSLSPPRVGFPAEPLIKASPVEAALGTQESARVDQGESSKHASLIVEEHSKAQDDTPDDQDESEENPFHQLVLDMRARILREIPDTGSPQLNQRLAEIEARDVRVQLARWWIRLETGQSLPVFSAEKITQDGSEMPTQNGDTRSDKPPH